MAAKGTPLGIGLSIDFANLDAQLSRVADKIAETGSAVSIKVGTMAGQAAKGEIGGDQLMAQVSQIGVQLSQGMASGIRMSSALMLAFGARINSMLDHLAGSAISLFTRIDNAMKGTRWTNFATGLSNVLANFTRGGGKKLSSLDKALTGAFGGTAKKVATIFNDMFVKLGDSMARSMSKSSVNMTKAFVAVARIMSTAMKTAMSEISNAVKALATSMSTSMLKSLETISMKLKDVRSSTVKAMKGEGGFTPQKAYYKQAREPMAKRPPRTEGELTGPFGPKFEMSRLAPKELAPPKPKFIGPLPKPIEPVPKRYIPPSGMKETLVNVSKQASEAMTPFLNKIRQTSAELGKIPTLFTPIKAAVAGASSAMAALPAPIQATARISSRMVVDLVQLGAEVTNLGLQVGIGTMKTVTFLGNMGSVGKKTYHGLFEGQAKWIALLGLVPAGMAANAITTMGRAASYLPGIFSSVASTAVPAIANVGMAAGKTAVELGLMGKAFAFLSTISPANIPVGVYFLAAKALGGVYRWFRKGKEGSDSFASSLSKSTQEAGLLGRTMSAATHPVQTLSNAFKNLAVQMTAAFGIVGLVYKAVEFLKSGTKAASDLNETVSASKVIFGDSFGAVNAQAEQMQASFGILKNEQLGIAQGFGAMAVGAGYSQAQAAGLANQLTQMAADLSSSKGAGMLPFAEAAQKIQSALAGEVEPLRKFGVSITETTTAAYVGALRLGKLAGSIFDVGKANAATGKAKPLAGLDFGKQGKLADLHARNQQRQTADQAKHTAIREKNQKLAEQRALPKAQRAKPTAAMAKPVDLTLGKATEEQLKLAGRAQAVMQGLGYAQGDLARTSTSAANQFRQAGGGVMIFAEKIGELLLPVIKTATVAFNALLGGILSMVETSGPVISGWVSGWSDLIVTQVENVKTIGPQIVESITWAWEEAKKGPFSFVTTAAEWLIDFGKGVIQGFQIMIRYPGILWKIATLQVGAFVENVMAHIGTLPENFGKIFTWIGANWLNMLKDMGRFLVSIGKIFIDNALKIGKAIGDALTGKISLGDVGKVFMDIQKDFFSGKQFGDAWKGFEKSTEALPELIKPKLVDVSGAIKDEYAKIGEMEVKRPKFKGGPETPEGKMPPGGKPPEAGKEYKLGGALEVGSKEAFSALSRNIAGKSSTTDAVKQGVAVQKDHLAVAKQQLAVAQGQAKMPALAVK